jgi:hypothetical protein
MKALFGFIWGLFAHHIGTKILSLLLAVLLFVFVQQSGRGETVIAEITLRFKLSEELQADYVLLDSEVRLSEVRIQGKRSVIEEVAREYALDNTREVTITRAFLGTHARGNRIEITSRLIRDIESRQIDVVAGLDGQRIRFDDKVQRAYEVVLAPDQADKLRLGKDSPYLPMEEDSDSVSVSFSIEEVLIEGPSSAFTSSNQKQLLIRIPDLDKALRNKQPADDGLVELPVTTDGGHVDWVPSGINPDLTGYLVLIDGTREMTDRVFESALQLEFHVRAQVVSKSLDVGIVVRQSLGGDFDVLGRDVLSNLMNENDLQKRKVNLPLRMPAALAERLEELGKNLVLVIDVTRGHETETGEFEVPLYLDFRDRSKGKLEDLRRIRIDIEDEPKAAFTKKKG